MAIVLYFDGSFVQFNCPIMFSLISITGILIKHVFMIFWILWDIFTSLLSVILLLRQEGKIEESRYAQPSAPGVMQFIGMMAQ